jgi:chromosome partitioning protein
LSEVLLGGTQVIAVGNQKGGVGKTTNTVHIARALAERGRRCLVWDLDMNCGATRHFGISSHGYLGTFEVLLGEEEPDDVIITHEDPDVELPKGVDLLAARRNLEGIDQALAKKSKFLVAQDVLLDPLRKLQGRYDFIFLDTAPNATTPTIAAYKAARWFILSAMPEAFAIAGLQDALVDLEDAQTKGNAALRVLGVIVTGFDQRTRLAKNLTDFIESTFRPPGSGSVKFETNISRSTVVPQAQKEGKTLFETNPTHRVTEEYRAIAQEIEERLARAARGEVLVPIPREKVSASHG